MTGGGGGGAAAAATVTSTILSITFLSRVRPPYVFRFQLDIY